MSRTKRINEMYRHESFEERFDYLSLGGQVGTSTFGFDRHVNQKFYKSREWKQVRDEVIVRDNGCDLGMPGYEIHAEILIHHINPLDISEIVDGDERIVNPLYLVTTTLRTHNAIHFGNKSSLPRPFVPRRPGDTKLW